MQSQKTSLAHNNPVSDDQSSNYWKGRRVCVTGGAGFLGSFLIEKLRAHGADQIFVPLEEEFDLTQPDTPQHVLEISRPDVVIHLAALAGGIGANRARPAEFLYKNIMMGVPLMHAAWERGVEKFVALGTICAYPKFTPVPFKEEDLWNGYPEETNAPYGLAKKMLLVQAQTYREQYGFNAIYLLPVNLYGPRDNFNLQTSHVIPALIRKCIEAQERGEKEVVLWGNGSATREFLYVEDAAEAIILATERYNSSEPVNLGSGSEISIKDLANLIGKLTGFLDPGYGGHFVWDTSKPNGQPRRALDISKAEAYFGFRARMPFEEGLRRTIEWYREHRPKQILPMKQIVSMKRKTSSRHTSETEPEVIRLYPTRGWAALKLGELWTYRELLFFLTWRQLKVRYQQTILGATWAILQPLLQMVVFTLIFSGIAKMDSGGVPYPIFSYTALLPWGLFSKALSDAGHSMVMNRSMITKIYFPRLLIPLASVLSGIVDFLIAFVVLLGMMVYYKIWPTNAIWTLPLFLLLALVSALGVGLWLSALNVTYRDVGYVLPFLTQFWMYLTPVVYPSSKIPAQWQMIYSLNPMMGVVEGFRWSILGKANAPGPMIAFSSGIALLILISGLFYFRRMERTFADIL